MVSRYAKLKQEWLLRGWTDMPWLLVNWRNGDYRRLKKDGFYVAQSCDGKTDFGSMAFLPGHIAMLNKFIAEGIAEECSAGDLPEPVQEYRQAANPLIRGIHWAITGRCNLNCRYCFMEAPSGRYGHPGQEAIRGLINQFERANVHQVSLTGGEPLLREDLPWMLGELTAKRIRLTEIVTNGTLITAGLLDSIKRMGQRPVFKISFDGAGVHDIMRGTRGTEALVTGSIRRVLAAGLTVAVTTTVDRDNLGSLAETYGLMKELGAPVWLIGRPQATGNWCGGATALATEAMAEACLDLLRRWLADGRPFHIMLERFFGGGPGVRTGPRDGRQELISPESYECQAVREKPYLLPDGRLLPCAGYTGTALQEKMPNLLQRELAEVWSDSPLRSLAEMRKREVLDRNPECAGCGMFPSCGAGCRAYALTETGSLLARDPVACAVWKGGYRRRFMETVETADKAAPATADNRYGGISQCNE